MKSVNKFIVEAYKKEGGLRSNTSSGFAMPEQQVKVVPLKLLMEAEMYLNGQYVVFSKGTKVYVREYELHSQPWAQKRYKADGIEGDFMIVDLSNVEWFE